MKFVKNAVIITIAVSFLLNSKDLIAGDEQVMLEPMIVTAQKREESSRNVPAAMDVFSDVRIEDTGMVNALELTRFTPNVYMKYSPAGNIIVFRGISAFHTSLYGPAGFYVDDVCYPLHYMHNPDFFDIDRIEVVKGPQGTMYGKNSESGVVNIITKQPDNEFRGKIFGEYGHFDTSHANNSYRLGGSISGPVVNDKLYVGLALLKNDSDGFMKNEYNDDHEAGEIDHINARGTLRWTPTDRWDISLIGDTINNDDGISYFKYFSGPDKTERHTSAYDGEYYSEEEGNGQTLRAKYKGDASDILSVTGRRDYEKRLASDFDCTPASIGNNIFEFKNKLLSEELRASSSRNNGPFQWLVGLYGFKEETDVDFVMQRMDPAMASTRNTEMDIDGYATFGQGTCTFFDRVHLTVGLRYEHLDLKGEQTFISAQGSKKYSKDMDYDEVLPKAALAYDLTDEIMSYATISRGYLAGGYSYNFATGPENFTYDPEYTWNYEMGIKTSWLNKMLMVDVSLFYINIEDKQVTEYVPGAMGVMKITNAAEAHSRGLEVELHARPANGLDLIAGFGYTDTEVDEWIATEFNMFTSGFEIYDYKGKELPNAPRYTYNLGVQYCHPSGFFGRADLLGTGDFYFDAKNNIEQKAYQLVNLRMGYKGELVDLIFWGKNVFDEEYETMALNWGVNELGQESAPRMLGVTIAYRF